MLEFIEKVGKELAKPLPGIEAQYRMATSYRYNRQAPPPDAMQAGVLVLFFPKDEEWHICLIERTSLHEQDRHRGQIGFPGGRYEQTDPSLEFTALREAQEEVGVDPDQVRVLGKLTELYIPVSNFLVHPYVGFTEVTPEFTPQLSEVQSILEVSFDYFRAKENIQTMDMKIREGLVLRGVPYYDLGGKVLWGATAMMLSELLAVLE